MPGSCVHPRAPIGKAVGVCVSLLLAPSPARRPRIDQCDDPVCGDVVLGGNVVGLPQKMTRPSWFSGVCRPSASGLASSSSAPGSSVSAKVGSRRTSRQRTNGSPIPPNGTQFFSPLYASEAIDPSCCNSTLVGASTDRLRALGMIRYLSSVDDRIDACQTATGVDQTRCRAHLDQFMMERVVPVVPILLPGMQTPSWTRVLRASIDPVDGGAGARSGRAGSGRRLTRLPGR